MSYTGTIIIYLSSYRQTSSLAVHLCRIYIRHDLNILRRCSVIRGTVDKYRCLLINVKYSLFNRLILLYHLLCNADAVNSGRHNAACIPGPFSAWVQPFCRWRLILFISCNTYR